MENHLKLLLQSLYCIKLSLYCIKLSLYCIKLSRILGEIWTISALPTPAIGLFTLLPIAAVHNGGRIFEKERNFSPKRCSELRKMIVFFLNERIFQKILKKEIVSFYWKNDFSEQTLKTIVLWMNDFFNSFLKKLLLFTEQMIV